MNCITLLTIISLALLTGTAQASSSALKGSQYLPGAKISLARARANALSVERGTIVDQELEREKGGSGLRFSFSIRVGKVVHEVGIDAVSGKTLEDSIDTDD